MRLTTLAALAALALAVPARLGAGTPTPAPVAKSAIETRMEAIFARGEYVILFAYRDADLESERIAERLKTLLPGLPKKAERVDLDFDNAAQRAFAESWHVHAAPFVLVIAPGGTVTGHFRYAQQLARIDRSFVPSIVVAILREIQNQKVVFLVINNPSNKNGRSIRNARKVSKMLRKSVALVEADASDKEAEQLLQDIGFNPQADPTMVYVISPRGQIAAKLSGDVTTKKLLQEFQTILVGKSGCGSMGRGPRATCE